LKSGQIANTPNFWGPLPWLDGPVAIHSFASDVVSDNDRPVPLSEVYVHHWLIFAHDPNDEELLFNDGVCAPLTNVFGIGAELRHSVYTFPEDYAIITTGKEVWTANLHFIRTTNVSDVQSAIECRCPDSDPPYHNRGAVGCCPDGGMCYGMHNSTINDPVNYYLKYTVGYSEITPEKKPLTVFSFDITAEHTYDCRIQYNVPLLATPSTNTTKVSMATVPSNVSIVLMELHLHIGGVEMTVEHYDAQGNYKGVVCSNVPTYGSGGPHVPGNETGYLVAIPMCKWNTPYPFVRGDQVKLIAVYDGRTIKGGHHYHSGVMGIIYMYGVAHVEKKNCVKTFNKLCNPPPYFSVQQCESCGWEHYSELTAAGCNAPQIKAHCQTTGGAGNVPSPVAGLSLNFKPLSGKPPLTLTLSGPQGSWFAAGWNGRQALMDGAIAWVYTEDENGKSVLQQRLLGNHQPGNVTIADMPHTAKTVNGTTSVTFVVKDALPGGRQNCVLFAKGDTMGGMQLQYHGSNRGTICNV